jgi:hypothetical protein
MSQVSDFFTSLKDDLLGRRLRPFLLLLVVALVAAVAYAVLGGGSSTPTTPVAASAPAGASAAVGDVTVSQAPVNPNRPVSETTNGSSKQHGGSARDPFTPLPGAKTAASSTASSTASPTTSSSTSGTSTSSAGGATPAPSKETTPAKPQKVYIHYHVTAQLGVVPPSAEGAPPQVAALKTYKDMSLDEPLPGKANPQLVYLGVVLRTGKDVLFGLTGEAILHGSATCQPSPTQCQAIEMQVGQSETLEVLEANGSSVTYELKLVSIGKSLSTASTARVRAAFRAQAKATRELTRRAPKLSELRYSPWGGGLVLAEHPAFAGRSSVGRADAARQHRR